MLLEILTDNIKLRIEKDIIINILQEKYNLVKEKIPDVLDDIYRNIPMKKRSSYGRVYTLKVLSGHLFSILEEMNAPIYKIGEIIFARSDDYRSKGVALGILSFYGAEDYVKVLPFFEVSASSDDWNLREFAQMFFRKLIQKHPNELYEYLLKLPKSRDPNIRRFVSETLRPVRENRWFFSNPEYPLSILRHLFRESAEYPRTSVGNNLSDLAWHLPERVLRIVEDLVKSGDQNAYWIAYRACRNLVKTKPIKVMDLLEVDEYRYKKKVYRRSDYSRDRGKVNTSPTQED